MNEITHYQDTRAHITDTSARFHSKTYALADITHAQTVHQRPPIIYPALLLAAGVIGLIIGLLFIESAGAFCLGLGALAIVLSALLFILAKPQYTLVLTIASQDTTVLKAPDQEYTQNLVNILNQIITTDP